MANLLPPRIKGPVSECSKHIRVRSQFIGALVEVVDMTTNTIVTSDIATSSDQAYNVTVALTPGHELAVRQTMGADASGLSADTVQIQSRPNPIGVVSFATPLFECGRCLWIEGLVPGADIKLEDNGVPIGSGHSHDGVARVHLSQAIKINCVIKAQQDACGNPGTVTTAPDPIESPGGKKQGRVLPAPTVKTPLIECSNRVTVSDVFPGARVELQRSGGPDLSACFDLPSLFFGVNPHLNLGESIRARQLFPDCEQESPWSDAEIVTELEPVPVPTVKSPLCKGGTNVTVCNLMAGARVRITVANKPHHGGFPVGGTTYEIIAPDDGCFDFALAAPGLPGDSVVYATQELCAKESDPSNVVEVEDAPAELPKPEVEKPLYECSTIVHVKNLRPGTRVYVYSESIGLIGEAQVFGEEADVVVAPLLQEGDKIYAVAKGCGLTSPDSDRVTVLKFDQFSTPIIAEPVYSCDTSVKVTNVIPGAWVDIFVNGVWRGRKRASTDEVDVPVQVGELHVGDLVTARQSLCGKVSEMSKPVRVQEFKGRWVRIGGDKQSQILAVHAALLPTGKILIFAGDEYEGGNRLPNPPKIDNTRLMGITPPYDVEKITGLPPEANLFCTGHSMLADGSVLVAGGTERAPINGFHGDHWFGPRESWRFVPTPVGSEKWDVTGKLSEARPGDVRPGFNASDSGGRWYPTLFTLPDGRVLALGGHPLEGDARHTNTSLELYSPNTNTWTLVGNSDYANIPGANEVPRRDNHSEYPRGHVIRDGTLFIASNMADGDVHKWQPYNDPQNWIRVAGTPAGYSANPQPYSTVLLPLDHENEYTPKVMIYGRTTPYVIAPESAMPSWQPLNGRQISKRRIYPLMTLLPSCEVFISGGTTSQNDVDAVKEGEMYTPSTNQWQVLPEASRVRNYHSTALLLPNGAVWHSGSNVDCKPGPKTRDLTVEVYEPWYFCWKRPVILDATDRVCHGERLHIETRDADEIEKVVLIRCSSFTHAFNPDQRLVSVPFLKSSKTGNLLIASLPSNPAILIAGYYLVFIVTGDNVPSEGKFVQICRSKKSTPGFQIDPDWWKKFFELLKPFPIDPKIIDNLKMKSDLLRLKQELPQRKISVSVEKIQILDDTDFIGKGEFQFSVKIHSRNMGGQITETQIPEKGHLSISDKEGKNLVAINREVFRGMVIDHLAIEVQGVELDKNKRNDILPIYRRVFLGSPDAWLGSIGPGNEMIEPEHLGDWKIWYKISEELL